MSDFILHFDTAAFEQLDQFALLVCQHYNLGNQGDWFGTFRGGLNGFYARLYGVALHYQTVHVWLPTVRSPKEIEYHLASIFFNLDSAIECLIFALNALGYAAMPSSFRDVSDVRALKRICPKDLLGDPSTNPPRLPLAGYATIFPNVQLLWQRKLILLNRIVEQHDVSKHRKTIFVGGMARLDPPIGFYESLSIPDDVAIRAQFWPMAEIILQNDPKLPRAERTPQPAADHVHLETLATEFVDFIRGMGNKALTDAQATIAIPEQSFRPPS